MATPAPTGKGGSSSSRDGTAKTMVADQITQSIQSTSNLLHLMLQSSPSQAELMKLPKSLFAKTSTIKNTELVRRSSYTTTTTYPVKSHKWGVEGIGAAASGDFIIGCSYGQRVTKCSSAENCNAAALKHRKLPAQDLIWGSSYSTGITKLSYPTPTPEMGKYPMKLLFLACWIVNHSYIYGLYLVVLTIENFLE